MLFKDAFAIWLLNRKGVFFFGAGFIKYTYGRISLIFISEYPIN